MTQSTQGVLGEREEQLGVSDRGVILFRRLVREAIEKAYNGGIPKGVLAQQRGQEMLQLDSFAGVRERQGG